MATAPKWLARWRVTKTWAQHTAGTSKGGVDYGAPAGTDILAPSDGWMTFRYFPDGSSVIRIERADGTATEFLHGLPFGDEERWVSALEHIGESGGAKGTLGAGPSTGPHIHVHDVNARGVRVPPFSTIPGTGAAGTGATPLPAPVIDYGLLRRQKEVDMYVNGATDRSTIYAIFTDANGHPRMRVCGANEAAAALAGKLNILCDDITLNALGVECGYVYKGSIPLPKVDLDLTGVTVPAPDLSPISIQISKIPVPPSPQEIAVAVIEEQKKPGN